MLSMLVEECGFVQINMLTGQQLKTQSSLFPPLRFLRPLPLSFSLSVSSPQCFLSLPFPRRETAAAQRKDNFTTNYFHPFINYSFAIFSLTFPFFTPPAAINIWHRRQFWGVLKRASFSLLLLLFLERLRPWWDGSKSDLSYIIFTLIILVVWFISEGRFDINIIENSSTLSCLFW